MSATQGVDDYYRNPAAKAALDNSDWMFLLRQKPESIEMMDKLGQLTMDDAMKRLLLSLRTEHGAYSEVFIHSPAGNGIGRLIVDPYSLLLFSSRARTSTPSTPSARRAWTSPRRSTRCCANGDSRERTAAALLVGANALVSAALIALVHLWLVPERLPALAVLDVAELYRLKELQVAAVLVKRDASDEERAGALRAAGFGTEVSTLLQALPSECRCIVLARGAVMGSNPCCET